MTDNKQNTVSVGDTVRHRFRPNYPIGTIVKIEDGRNAVCWVDFEQIGLGEKHLTICTKMDIVKT